MADVLRVIASLILAALAASHLRRKEYNWAVAALWVSALNLAAAF